MSAAAKVMMHYQDVSAETRGRIRSAKTNDLAFAIKRNPRTRTLTNEDVLMIAQIIVDAIDRGEDITQASLRDALRSVGRARDKSDELAKAVLP